MLNEDGACLAPLGAMATCRTRNDRHTPRYPCSNTQDVPRPSSIADTIDPPTYLQPPQTRPFKRRKHHLTDSPLLYLISLTLLVAHASAVFIRTFDNCLPDSILVPTPQQPRLLQWQTYLVDARFDHLRGFRDLNFTIYGNVTGQANEGQLPPPNSLQWSDPTEGFGKIVNVSESTNTATTLFTDFDVLSYTPASSPASVFCNSTLGVNCPIAPVFDRSARQDPSQLPAFTVGHRFNTSFAFSTIITTSVVKSGDASALDIACVLIDVTPSLGSTISNVLTYLPAAMLIFVAIGVVLAATLSPWGSLDAFSWTSNYGRDPDLLRLVTPGFGDCLQYIQFIVLAGSLSLAYPGYFQPVVRQAGWSALMFNESFVSDGPATQNPVDGIYVTNSTYGLTRMSQLIGMAEPQDLWANTVIWTLAIMAIVVVICQVGFATRKVVRLVSNNPAEDLRRKNWPFTGGQLVRIVCNFFLLPLVSLSLFQLVLAPSSPSIVVAFAVVLLAAMLIFAAWIFRLVATTKPRSHLFDDLPTVLLYGPLYNTYSDDAAPFALIPALLTFMRGVAIGAIQPSGIAQLVILAICEVVLILTLHAFRPFQAQSSMNAYHTFFAAVRLAVVLLMVAFVPDLGVSEGTKGWIGYVILLLHAIVLVFGFFLNAVQTIVETSMRMAGAGGEEGTGAASRGGLIKAFGVRQLSKRQGRQDLRQSVNSRAAFLADDHEDAKSNSYGGRSRSLSASSAIMLNAHRTSDPRLSQHLDRTITGTTIEGEPINGHTNIGNGQAKGGRKSKPDLNIQTDPSDPYYRPPRARRQTNELLGPGAPGGRTREAARGSADLVALAGSPETDLRDPHTRTASGSPQNVAPAPAYMRTREASETDLAEEDKDYAVREVDYYYGVRGPALSKQGGTRKLKTGPADPVGPVSSATGWFKGMFGGKKKESGKGFEVVRSSRAPPPVVREEPEEEDDLHSPQVDEEPYRDSPVQPTPPPPQQQEAYVPGERTRSSLRDDESILDDDDMSPVQPDEPIVPERAPSLGPLDSLGGLDFRPSRWSSRVSQRPLEQQARAGAPSSSMPHAPPRSPRRPTSSERASDPAGPAFSQSLSTVRDSRDFSEVERQGDSPNQRIPFSSLTVDEAARRPSTSGVSYPSDDERHGRSGSETRDPNDSYGLMPGFTNPDRPTSFGFVNQFRTSDMIHQPHLGENEHAASSAEVVSATPRRSRERDSFSNIGRAE